MFFVYFIFIFSDFDTIKLKDLQNGTKKALPTGELLVILKSDVKSDVS